MSDAVNLMPAPAESDNTCPGRRLADARRAQNLTAADIARQLKLSVWQVEALEAGRYHQLPGPIFVRGFFRNYARLMKLDAGELLRAAGDSLPQPAARREPSPAHDIPFPSQEAPRWPWYAAALVAIVGALAVYEFYWNEPEGRGTRPPAAATNPATAPVKAASTPVRAVKSGAELPAVREALPTPVTTAPAAQLPVATEPLPESERPSRLAERQVRLDFDDESWVEIRDRNERIIFSQLNRAGTQQLIYGLPPFSIVVGNAQGVRMTYDDRPVDLALHTKIDVARLILQ